MRTHEAQREGRKRDKLDRELKTARLDLESKNVEIKNKQGTLQKLQEECSRLEASLKEQKVCLKLKQLLNFIVITYNSNYVLIIKL